MRGFEGTLFKETLDILDYGAQPHGYFSCKLTESQNFQSNCFLPKLFQSTMIRVSGKKGEQKEFAHTHSNQTQNTFLTAVWVAFRYTHAAIKFTFQQTEIAIAIRVRSVRYQADNCQTNTTLCLVVG